MFLNCLLLDRTVIDLMPIVHMDKIWVEILQKNLKCGRPGGGGSTVISDTPGRGGRGVKKGPIFADVLYGWPLTNFKDLNVINLKPNIGTQ